MASFLRRLFGGGGTSAPQVGTNPYSANPYTTGGVQPMNIGGFKPAPAGFQWGTGSQMGGGSPVVNRTGFTPNFGGVGSIDAFSNMGKSAMGASLYNPDDEEAKTRGYGGEKKGSGRIGKIRDLLTGESGAAIGGIAQGAGSVIGAYMNRKAQGEMTKLERQKFEEELRREAAMEEQRQAIRDLLMPTIQQLRPR